MVININIADKRPTVEGAPVIVCGNSDYTIQFTFDDEWSAGTYKTARFVYVQGGLVKHEDVNFTGDTVAVPAFYGITRVHVGVYVGELRTSAPAVISCDPSILCGSGTPADPTPDENARILELLNLAINQQAATEDAMNRALAAANQAEAAAAWDTKANALVTVVEGNPAQFWPDEGSVVNAVSVMNPVQAGSGDPYPAGGGKNLLPYPYQHTTKTENGITFTDNGDGSITVNGTSTGTAYFNMSAIPELDGVDFSTPTFHTTNGEYVFSMSDVGYGFSAVHTAAAGARVYLRIQSGKTISNVTVYPMVEKGTVPTAWQPYANIRPITGRTDAQLTRSGEGGSDVLTLDFGQTVYGGTLDWNAGVLQNEWNVYVLDGTETITREDRTGSYRWLIKLPNPVKPANSTDGVCSHFVYDYTPIGDNSKDGVITVYGASGSVYARYDAITTVEAMKAFLAAQHAAGTPVTVCYRVAEPTATQLTPQQVLGLKGLNTVITNTDGMTTTYNKSLAKAFDEVLAMIAGLTANNA